MDDDQIDMEDIKYSSGNEDMTIIENNFSNLKKRYKRC